MTNEQKIESLKEQNTILREALQDQIDYHHHIGNSDCPYTVNQILVKLYKTAKEGLKTADTVKQLLELQKPLVFSSEEFLKDIKAICDDYQERYNLKPHNNDLNADLQFKTAKDNFKL